MKDDFSSDSKSFRQGDVPGRRSPGLFRRPSAEDADAADGGAEPTRLRVVSSLAEDHVPTPRPPSDPWEALRQVPPGRKSAIVSRLAQGGPDPVADSFDYLRTTLLKALRSDGLNRIAVAAPTRGCGATFTAVHLGLSLARIPGGRAVLMDLNMRRPGVAAALDMPGVGNTRAFLRGSIQMNDHIVRVGETLAVGLTQVADAEASHLLHSDCCAMVVADLVDRLTPEVLICDLPPVLEHDDLSAFLPQVDGVLLVADAMQTSPDHIAACERRLAGQTRLLGVVLNQARRVGPAPVYA